MNYYNEFDAKAAAWLRELIRCGLIPPGEVDQRSIVSVRGAELAGFTQCHFFAGIGGWSLALQLANWPQDRPVWTGSCPCQPFSNSGSRLGTADERHLWPEFARLIAECQPANVFGEQVASKAGRVWLAGVRTDLESMGYAVGGADLCAAGVGAPHIRQRIYWMAVSDGRGGSAGLSGSNQGQEGDANFADNSGGAQRSFSDIWGGGGQDLRMVYAHQPGLERLTGHENRGNQPRWIVQEPDRPTSEASAACFWSPSRLLQCTDGKARRIEPGSFPLVNGLPGRVGLLRGYGNAIVPQLAAEFIQALTS